MYCSCLEIKLENFKAFCLNLFGFRAAGKQAAGSRQQPAKEVVKNLRFTMNFAILMSFCFHYAARSFRMLPWRNRRVRVIFQSFDANSLLIVYCEFGL